MSNIDKQALREAAEKATESDWIVDAHEGWHAVIPVADTVNGNYIIAEFQGPESKRNRDFVAAANPVTVLALLDELEAAEKTSAARLEALDRTHKMYQREKECTEAAEKRIADYQELISGLVGVSSSILREVERINKAAGKAKGE